MKAKDKAELNKAATKTKNDILCQLVAIRSHAQLLERNKKKNWAHLGSLNEISKKLEEIIDTFK